ncbi:MAG: purine-binding chemotaxis protein CheW [Peptococcaceae bacterium]|nr:purine-binding chemotaxis protein CheW [Peptococcaceae bacterium]
MSKKQLQLVIFGINAELYAIDTQGVKEISRMEDITPIPRTKPYIEGILNLRGQIIPVVCLRKRLGLPERVDDKETRIIIIDFDELRVGLIVDFVSEVITLIDSTLIPAPEVATAAYVAGLCHYNNNLVIVINIEALFAEQHEIVAEIGVGIYAKQ